jgi:hypothetical protein
VNEVGRSRDRSTRFVESQVHTRSWHLARTLRCIRIDIIDQRQQFEFELNWTLLYV